MKLATLLYVKNSRGEYLLMERAKNPNMGLISPPGGKLKTDEAESPFGCAVREFEEECGIKTVTQDWELTGIVTEDNYPGIGNIMIFLLSYKNPVDELPKDSIEGKFVFVHPDNFKDHKIPETDKLFIWKFVLDTENVESKPFSLKIDCNKEPFEGISEAP